MLYGAKHGNLALVNVGSLKVFHQVWKTLKHYREANIPPHFLNHVTSALLTFPYSPTSLRKGELLIHDSEFITLSHAYL